MVTKRVKLEIGDVIMRVYTFDGRLGSHTREPDYDIVIEVEDNFAMTKTQGKTRMSNILNPVIIEVSSGKIVGTDSYLVSRIFNE